MAKLDDVAESLNVKLNIKQQTSNEKVSGHKRRSWLEQDDTPTILPTENRIHSDFDQLPTENKLKTNLRQTEDKPNTNPTQSRHKADTNLTQSEHDVVIKNTYQTQTTHKVHTKLNTQKTQTTHKLHTNYTQTTHISTLIGVQRHILLFIFEECKKARSHVTEPLSIQHIASGLEIALGSIKTSISRLCEKQFLKINGYKNGRGGWSVYEIPEIVYKELLQMETQHKLHTNYTQSTHKVHTKPNTQLNTNPSCSSSFKDLKTTTTGQDDKWNFDITPYAQFGFTKTQIKQLAKSSVISASDVQQSLIEFSYDMDNNALPPIKTTKINFLMGLMWKGQSYVSEGFKNEQDATIEEMARRSRVKKENVAKAKFEVWEEGLSDEERNEIEKKLPTHLIVLHRAHGVNNAEVKKWMFDYYLKKGI
jgi:hypothetical protein